MLTPEQINNIHRLHWGEKQSVRKIARQLHLGRRTIAKYLTTIPTVACTLLGSGSTIRSRTTSRSLTAFRLHG
jgi:IS30 family transposase